MNAAQIHSFRLQLLAVRGKSKKRGFCFFKHLCSQKPRRADACGFLRFEGDTSVRAASPCWRRFLSSAPRLSGHAFYQTRGAFTLFRICIMGAGAKAWFCLRRNFLLFPLAAPRCEGKKQKAWFLLFQAFVLAETSASGPNGKCKM